MDCVEYTAFLEAIAQFSKPNDSQNNMLAHKETIFWQRANLKKLLRKAAALVVLRLVGRLRQIQSGIRASASTLSID